MVGRGGGAGLPSNLAKGSPFGFGCCEAGSDLPPELAWRGGGFCFGCGVSIAAVVSPVPPVAGAPIPSFAKNSLHSFTLVSTGLDSVVREPDAFG